MKQYTRSMYGTSARDTNKLNKQIICGFCSYGGHVRRNCVLRKHLAEETVALSNAFYRKNHELCETIRPPQYKQKQMREHNLVISTKNNIQRRSLDTKVQLIENNSMRKPSQKINDVNLRKYQQLCAPSPTLSAHATNEKIALFHEIYLARIQSKSSLKPLEQNSTCATDQSTTQIIECLKSHDLSADLHLLFNDSNEDRNESKSAPPCTLIASSIRENHEAPIRSKTSASIAQKATCVMDFSFAHTPISHNDTGSFDLTGLFSEPVKGDISACEPESVLMHTPQTLEISTIKQLDGQIHKQFVCGNISGTRVTSFNKITNLFIPGEVYFNICNSSTWKNRSKTLILFCKLNFVTLTKILGSKFHDENVSGHIHTTQVQPNWKKRKRQQQRTLFVIYFTRTTTNAYTMDRWDQPKKHTSFIDS